MINQNEESNYMTNNNATSINIDYSTNKLPLWAKKGLKINDDCSSNSLVHQTNAITSPMSRSNGDSILNHNMSSQNRTRISLYNSRSSADSDERNSSVDEGMSNTGAQFDSPIDRFKKKAHQLSNSLDRESDSNAYDEINDHAPSEEQLTNKKKNPLYVSTENLKFNDNFFAKTAMPKANSNLSNNTSNQQQYNSASGTLDNHYRLGSGQKSSTLMSTPKVTNNQLNTSLNTSGSFNNSLPSAKSMSSLNTATINNASTTSTINRTAPISKRREELAKALNEARAKLQNLTDINRKSTGGLATSMSVANINRLSLNLSNSKQQNKENNSLLISAPIQKASNRLSTSINQQQTSAYENDTVRRSISLSDLSHSQMLANRSLTLKHQQQQMRNKLSPATNNVYYPLRNLNLKKSESQLAPQQPSQSQFDPPQGLWGDVSSKNQQPIGYHQNERMNSSLNASQTSINQLLNHHQQSNTSTPTHKPIRVRMSRSSSMASINKSDSLARNLDNNKPQGLWNSPSQLSINTLRSTSSAQGTAFNKYTHHNKSSHYRKGGSSDDESSSDENDLYHRISQRPSTPPKPNIRQLRRSSTTSNNLFLPTGASNTNNAHNTSNLTSQQQQQNNGIVSNTMKSNHKTSSARKSWNNNFELRPAKSEYNLNSMGQETVNSPSSGFWSNQSNSGGGSNGHHHANYNGTSTITNGNFKLGKQNTIGYENLDLANINPATVPLSSELFQHIVDELNHLGTIAKKVHYRAQAEDNEKLCNLLKEGVSKAYVNLATIVPFSSNKVLPITKSLNNHAVSPANGGKESNSSFNHHFHHNNLSANLSNGHNNHQAADSSNTDHDTEEDNMSNPSVNNHNSTTGGHVSLTSDSASSSLPQEQLAMNLLQHYSERLLSMVEGQIRNKDK